MPPSWHPASWQDRPALQQPAYPDDAALQKVLGQLACLPPLVTSWEVRDLKKQLAEAGRGERFVLQGGDCAESFDECRPTIVVNRLKVLLQMSLVLIYGLKLPVVRIGRFAGQYAKPRSSDSETRDGVTLPSYRGDIVNRPAFTPKARTPDPHLLLRAFSRSAITHNFVRALAEGGFADVHHPEYWNLAFAADSPLAEEYHKIVGTILDAVRFSETVSRDRLGDLHRTHFYTSHEALLLHYEQALTRTVPHAEGHYNLGTHFPWIGMRTAEPSGAHVEYARGIANPIGVKVGPGMTEDWLLDLIATLNPNDEPGRLTLIHRFGAERIADGLPPLIEAIQRAGKTVTWICDPMHGNTRSTEDGTKTRRFDDILRELEHAFAIHAACGTHLGGVHFELTGENVTECVGGARGLDEAGLKEAYKSQVDPRLNYEQSLEMALRLVRMQQGLATV